MKRNFPACKITGQGNGRGIRQRIRQKNKIKMAAVLIAASILLYPDIARICINIKSRAQIKELENESSDEASLDADERSGGETDGIAAGGDGADASKDKPAESGLGKTVKAAEGLRDEIKAYNRSIYINSFAVLTDIEERYASADVWDELADKIFGYIEIPAMDVALPIYVGASDKNLAKGAAVCEHTSLPIGGMNTNSVIAGHRGYMGIPFFREIEKISPGDKIAITNPWETLWYVAESIGIVEPTDSDAIGVQEGKDMVTLLSCHPYRSGGKYRYLVYCVRDADGSFLKYADNTEKTITTLDGELIEPSAETIGREIRLRRLGAAGLLILAAFCIFCEIKNSKKGSGVKERG